MPLIAAEAPHPKKHDAKPVSKVTPFKRGRPAPDLDTPTDLDAKAVTDITKALNRILADSFALYLKTKNFHWHVSGPHFRSYHLLFDEQAAAIFATTDEDRGARAQDRRDDAAVDRPHRQGAIGQGQRRGLRVRRRHGPRADERQQGGRGRDAQGAQDLPTTTRTSRRRACWRIYIDAAEKRTWFLFESARKRRRDRTLRGLARGHAPPRLRRCR